MISVLEFDAISLIIRHHIFNPTDVWKIQARLRDSNSSLYNLHNRNSFHISYKYCSVYPVIYILPEYFELFLLIFNIMFDFFFIYFFSIHYMNKIRNSIKLLLVNSVFFFFYLRFLAKVRVQILNDDNQILFFQLSKK